MIEVPILLNFDPRQQIGTLVVDPAKLPPGANWTMALGGKVLEKNEGGITKFELMSLSPVLDENYQQYLTSEASQLVLNLDAGRKGRDTGMQRALAHAERVAPGWQAEALARFKKYALTHREFLTEDVREANPDLPEAPDRRAWGGIVVSAIRAGVVKKIGYREARDPKVHGSINTLWQSLTYQEVGHGG